MISKAKPEGFEPNLEVVGCYLLFEGKILFLQRHEEKIHGGKWGLPAGKAESIEKPEDAVIREVQEEAGINLTSNQISKIGEYFVDQGEQVFVFHTFQANLSDNVVIIKPDEIKGFGWFEPKEALKLDLVPDADFCIVDFISSQS